MTFFVARDLNGMTFGRLTVLGRCGIGKSGCALWQCKCECGTVIAADSGALVSSRRRSCGCLRRETALARIHELTRHGMTDTPTHRVWLGMLARCLNSKVSGFNNYGGRGIKVCERWMTFENFLADMGQRPSSGDSIDRINNDGDYEPGNCRWTDISTQANNRRTNRCLSFCGETLTVTQWAKKAGIHRATISGRLKRGWSVDRALTEPVEALAVRS